MVGNDAMQFRPQPVYIRAAQALYPFATFRHPFGRPLGAGGLWLLAHGTDWRQLNLFFDFVT
jgi:hypothetical protein